MAVFQAVRVLKKYISGGLAPQIFPESFAYGFQRILFYALKAAQQNNKNKI